MKRALAMQFINKMALTIAASQSDASLLTAIDASIRRADERKGMVTQYTSPEALDTDRAKYDTFKQWATNRQGEQQAYPEPTDPLSVPSSGIGELGDMDNLFDGFEWSAFDASLFELDDDNMKDLFANFDTL